jgi:hypothetical protein
MVVLGMLLFQLLLLLVLLLVMLLLMVLLRLLMLLMMPRMLLLMMLIQVLMLPLQLARRFAFAAADGSNKPPLVSDGATQKNNNKKWNMPTLVEDDPRTKKQRGGDNRHQSKHSSQHKHMRQAPPRGDACRGPRVFVERGREAEGRVGLELWRIKQGNR